MKTIKKVLMSLLSILMTVSLVSCNSVETIKKEVNTAEGPYAGKTIILHSNDSHGTIEGFANMAFVKKDFESKGATVILVDDGDFTQGSIYVTTDKGKTVTEVLEKTGYDIVALGNHEFDYGFDQLKSNFEGKSYKVLCSNVTNENGTIFDSNAIFSVGDLKIGFFALLTPETQTKVNPNYVKGFTFVEKNDLYDLAQKEIDNLKKSSDLVICLGHLGVDDESAGNRSLDVLAGTTGIDFFIDGHSHTVLEKGENGEKIQSTGANFENIGVIVIDNKTKTIENNYLLSSEETSPDNDLLDEIQTIVSKVDSEYGSVFANSEVELDGVKEHVRSYETNLGDLVADSMVWSVLKDGSIEVPDENVLAITNGGGIRANIAKGGVTYKDINTVLPFGNTIAVDYITGEELLEALEASTFCTPEPVGGFPQVSGIKFTVNTLEKYDAGEEYPDSTYFAPKSIKRVTVDEVNGKPFDPSAKYAVVTNDFLASGGDTYYSFLRAYSAGEGFDTGIVLDEALEDYITNELGGVIGSQYEKAQERIMVAVK